MRSRGSSFPRSVWRDQPRSRRPAHLLELSLSSAASAACGACVGLELVGNHAASTLATNLVAPDLVADRHAELGHRPR